MAMLDELTIEADEESFVINSSNMIFNKSLTSGIFPTKWKASNLTPVFKSGQNDVVTNYRGISPVHLV